MKKINKKTLPAIILIIAIMIIGFAVQFFSFKDDAEISQSNEQAAEYNQAINDCQVQAEKGTELTKECQEILNQK